MESVTEVRRLPSQLTSRVATNAPAQDTRHVQKCSVEVGAATAIEAVGVAGSKELTAEALRLASRRKFTAKTCAGGMRWLEAGT